MTTTTTDTCSIADFIAADRAEALDEADNANRAILGLQATDTWIHLPIETRRALCSARLLLEQVAAGLDSAA
jgi:hypothetical protein